MADPELVRTISREDFIENLSYATYWLNECSERCKLLFCKQSVPERTEQTQIRCICSICSVCGIFLIPSPPLRSFQKWWYSLCTNGTRIRCEIRQVRRTIAVSARILCVRFAGTDYREYLCAFHSFAAICCESVPGIKWCPTMLFSQKLDIFSNPLYSGFQIRYWKYINIPIQL